jgi:hypothetical protein
MPSEDRSAQALTALARPREAFRSAVVAAIDEMNVFLAGQRAPAALRASQEAVRLGAFADGRIDVERFSGLVGAAETLDSARLDALDHALRVLKGFAAQDEELFHVRVRRGADLRDSIRDALATRGRAFNTAHQVDILRTGRAGLHVELEYGTLDFRHWTRAERLIAPPLVVEVHGADVHVAGLAEYLDGAQKIVLVIDGPVAPAVLARLIAPHTFVMQTADAAAVERLAGFAGPGIAAVLEDAATCALFVHDPSAGSGLAERLRIDALPEKPRRRSAGASQRQQAEELAWLTELSHLAAVVAASAAGAEEDAGPAVTPADQLAAWLLRQTDLSAAE